jgi:tetratricopeptide (TPR) repeat protein
MKSCPTCNRTFEDTLTYCLIDGSILSAPFDPHATLVIPEPRQTEPPPTEVLKLEETKQEIPPTIRSPQSEEKHNELVSTIDAPAPAFELTQIKDSPAQTTRKSNQRVWIIGGIIVLLLIGIGIAYKLRETASKHDAAGEKLFTDSKYAEAETEFRQAVKLEPNNSVWHNHLAYAFALQNKKAEAEAEWKEAIRLSPNNYEYRLSLANNLEEEEKYAEAEREYREVLRLTINSQDETGKFSIAMYHWRLGLVLEKERNYPEAEAEYREAVRLKPDDTDYPNYLKRVLAAQGK